MLIRFNSNDKRDNNNFCNLYQRFLQFSNSYIGVDRQERILIKYPEKIFWSSLCSLGTSTLNEGTYRYTYRHLSEKGSNYIFTFFQDVTHKTSIKNNVIIIRNC